MPQVFKNGARASLAAAIGATDTSLVISAALADLFPTANTGTAAVGGTTDWFKVVLQDSSGNIEIVYVRTRSFGSGVMSNLLRGREGTTARAFAVGTIVGLRLTADDVSASVNILSNANTWSAEQTFTGPVNFTGEASFTQPIDGDLSGNAATATAASALTQAALDKIYPVGSVYMNATNSTNPATLLGFGTWVAFGAGRVPVGFDGSDALFNAAEKTGGSKDAIVVAHSHTGSTSSAGAHSHSITLPLQDNAAYAYQNGPQERYVRLETNTVWNTSSAGAHTHDVTVGSTGSSGTNGNVQPYITVYMWKRTA